MKKLIHILFFFLISLSYGQETSSIIGKINSNAIANDKINIQLWNTNFLLFRIYS